LLFIVLSTATRNTAQQLIMPPTASKKVISNEAWEAKLAAVKIAKEDMNRLVMNFLVTEV
jgi:hypothetical protein